MSGLLHGMAPQHPQPQHARFSPTEAHGLHSPLQSPSPKLGGQYNAALGAAAPKPEVDKLPAPPPIMGLHPSRISVEFHKPQGTGE